MTQENARHDGQAQAPTFDDAVADREAWAAWRQLLDAAQGEFERALGDPARLAERVERRIVRRRRHRRRRLSLAAALLLACGAAGWFTAGRPSEIAPALPLHGLADAADWEDDALDLELAWALRRADALESQWRRPADGVAYMRQRMNALEAEFDGGSL
jgi:hypothetical protein